MEDAHSQFRNSVPLSLWSPIPPMGWKLHCHSHPMANCISPRVLCSCTMRFAYFAPWGNVFHFQEFKNITMTCAGIPPTPQKPLYRGYGGGGCIKSPLQGTIESLCPPGASPETLYPRGASAGPRPPRSTARKVPREAPAEHANPRHPQKGITTAAPPTDLISLAKYLPSPVRADKVGKGGSVCVI